jgi:hypothetical protein
MPANRPNLTLDEQSFQGLLSAAFTIQEHNDRLKLAGQTPAEPQARLEQANTCPHCGAPKPAAPKAAEGSRCESCGLDEFRPGERLQHNWASMWLMSQEQRLWPERSPIAQEETAIIQQREPGKAAAEGRWITEATDDFPREGLTQENLTQEELPSEGSDLAVQPFQLSAFEDSYATDASISLDGNAPSSVLQRFTDWHMKLRFHRADLYLGVAVFVAALALLWPAAGAPRPAALGTWERALVTLGIAEVPAPVVHFQGDPSLAVWVDPHTALYYCPGEEQYGKTVDGRFSPQREAQMDRFEPASRSACE